MELFDILTKGIFTFRRSSLLEQISQIKLNFDENTIPALHQAQAAFVTFETKGRYYVELMGKFYEKTSMRKSDDWINDWLGLMQSARQNLNFVEELVKKHMEAEVYSDGISIQKAQLVSIVSGLEYISANTLTILNLMVLSADQTVIGRISEDKSVYEEASRRAERIFGLLADYGRTTAEFQKLFKQIPDAVVTPGNKAQVLSVWGKKVDTFENASASGFVPNIPMLIGDQIVEVRLWMYNRDKIAKKQMEQRILYLRTRNNGESTAALEKIIKNYESEITKLQDKIDNFEEKYGDK